MENSHETLQNQNSGDAHRQPVEATEKSWFQKLKDKFLPGVRITLLISLIFYIAMFIVGIWGVHKCPVSDNIPFFLIVTGGIGLISKLTSILREALSKHAGVKYAESSFYTVETVFLLLGSYWVFRVYKPSFEPSSSPHYCNKTVYMFAFVYLAALYSILIVIALCFCCFLGCIFFVKKTETNNEDPESPSRPMQQPAPENNH